MSSVLKSKRGESAVQFLDTARELEIYTIKTCARFPKRYMFLVTKGIVDLSRQIYNDVKAANSIYPTNAAEAQLRKTTSCKQIALCKVYYRNSILQESLYGKTTQTSLSKARYMSVGSN